MKKSKKISSEDIAIIGYSFKFPGAVTKSELWDILSNKKSSISNKPNDRWNWPEWVNPKTTHIGIDKGGFIKDVNKFDASFFKISPREANIMDPQQRLMLELTWELLEDAGYSSQKLKGSKTGVYIGASGSDYDLLTREQLDDGIHQGTGTTTLGAVIPNRISYFFDFDGPSMLIDTACSSSLVAVHQAVNAIRSGECLQAVAGGVNVKCHHGRSLAYFQSKMLSKDGKCQTFDEKANGFVRSEGAAVILMKSLSQAISDGDRICAVIKGTSINHGGQAKGLTVPDSKKQSELIIDAYRKKNIDIQSINYIEAHGTGTGLGDPIEVVGLSMAFNELKKDGFKFTSSWCGLGSIKTNIGHLEAASGMAGIVKILLSMEKQKLPATRNFDTLNPKLSLKNSPFYIHDKITEWKPSEGYTEVRAGISSFGLGGANGHVLLESFTSPTRKVVQGTKNNFFFILSAKNKERLKDYVKKWIEFIDSRTNIDIDLASISYVLATGREFFEERMAIVFKNKAELKAQLLNYIHDEKSEKLFKGNARGASNSIGFLEEQSGLVSDWIKERSLDQLCKYWSFGLSLDWSPLFKNENNEKLSLPKYPFARNKHWIELKPKVSTRQNYLHPLLHENTSDYHRQQFTSTFTGKEQFLDDHVVGAEKILPAVAQLELLREAGERSTKQKITRFSNLNWIRPISVKSKPINVHLDLYPLTEGVTKFKLFNNENGNESIYSKGCLETLTEKTNKIYDINSILDRVSNTKERKECYNLLKSKKLNLGESYQGVNAIYYNEKETLGQIILRHDKEFEFTPGVLDSCLQSCLLWYLFREEEEDLALPYSVKEIIVYKPLSQNLWCYSRKSSTEGRDQLEKYDIDILNEHGEVLIELKEFLFFPLDGFSASKKIKTKLEVAIFDSVWNKKQLVEKLKTNNSKTLIYLIDVSKKVSKTFSDRDYFRVEYASNKSYEQNFMFLFKEIRLAIQQNEELNIVVVGDEKDYYKFSFLSGLIKTASEEHRKITGKIIGINSLNEIAKTFLTEVIQKEIATPEIEIKYLDKNRFVKSYRPTTSLSQNVTKMFKDNGVYIITGGTGGLGLIFAKYISNKVNAKILLIGRRPLNKKISSSISNIPGAIYCQVDVNIAEEVKEFMAATRDTYGSVDGIIHSAGVIQDSLILKKSKEQISTVLKPKIIGTNNLDELTKDDTLDFFILFSSVAAVLGNIGQSDYSAANTYLDAFAEHRNKMVKSGQRKGKTISINWSLWEDGGMKIDSANKSLLVDKWHMVALPTNIGISAFETLFNSSAHQAIIAYGNKSRIFKTIISSSQEVSTYEKLNINEISSSNSNDLSNQVTQKLRAIASGLLKLNEKELKNDVEWGEYGFDSVMLTEFSNALNSEYKLEVNPTIFYNYSCLQDLVTYLIDEYSEYLTKIPFSVVKNDTLQNITITDSAPNNSLDIISEKLINTIKSFASELLKLEVTKIDNNIEWGEYGFDSVMLTEFSNKLNQYYDLEVNPTIFYNCTTIESLSERLLDENHTAINKKHSSDAIPTRMPIEKVQDDQFRNNRFGHAILPIPKDIDYALNDNGGSLQQEAIAIIGVHGRFPESPDLDTFWNNISDKKDLIKEIPSDRWDWKKHYGDPIKDGNKTKAKWGGFIKDLDKFDPLFFNISPREAELMDPQQRITLESIYSALEDAGISSNSIKGTDTGVFIGVASSDYAVLLNNNPVSTEAEFSTGEAHSILANRVSYLLDIHGPSEPIDTACSSSLLAIHRAVENIRNGSCSLAIAGGVNAIITPQRTLSFSQAGMLSKDGRCKTFDEDANGYVRGEGVGFVILKSLAKAKADGDQIYGLVRNTSENHGGKANTLTSPNPIAQTRLLVKAYNQANIDPRNVSYIEAHGTGTPLGDPIEIEGLKSAFSELYKTRELPAPEKPHCAIGSVKTNIGHLEAAAGIAGVLKVIYALKNKTLPGNPNLKTQNKFIKLENTPFFLLKDTIDWETPSMQPRIAGISSFGFGGANAHVIIEEYQQELLEYKSNEEALIILSAKNKDRLNHQVHNLLKYIKSKSTVPSLNIHNIAYTLQVGRVAMEERLAFLAGNIDELINKLQDYLNKNETDLYTGNIEETKSNFILEGGAGEAYIKYAIENKENKSLAQLWVKGVFIDWKILYSVTHPQKISLPTYPFARDRHWVDDNINTIKTKALMTASKLHPLVHLNTSNFEEQKFTSKYTGDEFFFSDHIVDGTKVLPGVAYLELVLKAASISKNADINRVNNIMWLSPLGILEGKGLTEITTNLYDEDIEIAFEVQSNIGQDTVTHSVGTVSSVSIPSPSILDISLIKDRCNFSIKGEQFYSKVKHVGVSLGHSFRGIQELFYNDTEAISQIRLDITEDFALPPGLMDSAIQTYVGVDMDNSQRVTGIPYRIDEVTIFRDLKNSNECWAYAKRTFIDPDNGTPHFDIDLVDLKGNVLVQFRGLIILSVKQKYQVKEEKQTLSIYASHWITSANKLETYA